MNASWPPEIDLLDIIDGWLVKQRWFPGSEGESVRLVASIDLTPFADPVSGQAESAPEPQWISILEVGQALIQVPLSYTATRPNFGVIAKVRDAWLVDGPYCPGFLRAWWRYTAAHQGLLTAAGDFLDEQLAGSEHSRVITGEQSNTSVIFDDRYPCILKFLRVLHPGVHPEVEITTALAERGFTHVAHPLAALQQTLPQISPEPLVLGFASTLVRQARDGFELFVEKAARGEEATDLARDLGVTTAALHRELAQALGTVEPGSSADLKQRLEVGLAAASQEVPQLREASYLPQLNDAVEAVGELEELPPLLRIHGDYHLGQVLHGPTGWTILDFEGEPLRSLDERRQADFALRDVAGMLRSFDYAAAKAGAPAAWVEQCQQAFCDGYSDSHGFTPAQSQLLRALQIEKAAYEVIYEYRLRPDWLPIPLTALSELATG